MLVKHCCKEGPESRPPGFSPEGLVRLCMALLNLICSDSLDYLLAYIFESLNRGDGRRAATKDLHLTRFGARLLTFPLGPLSLCTALLNLLCSDLDFHMLF